MINEEYERSETLSSNDATQIYKLLPILTDLRGIKKDFDSKWDQLESLISSLGINSNAKDQLPSLQEPSNKPIDLVKTLPVNKRLSFNLDMPRKFLKTTIQEEALTERSPSVNRARVAPLLHRFSTLSQNTANTTFLIRDQLIGQLEHAKKMLQREEQVKLKLVQKLREMNTEVQALKRQNQDDTDELVQFAANESMSQVKVNRQNKTPCCGGQENVQDSQLMISH
ncbi:hypothetical protein FGO68_gene906 [Halteria grandinella]|uniref:Uncharacterized protein n=1 Tax=Halteria grandinella TaxID=5974 RepID=A0A8J8T310_HALGN|nr:hypothetical protein FGO68_gene906 [Halteria grandinella]